MQSIADFWTSAALKRSVRKIKPIYLWLSVWRVENLFGTNFLPKLVRLLCHFAINERPIALSCMRPFRERIFRPTEHASVST